MALSRATRVWFAIAAVVLVGAVAIQVAAARLPGWALITELALFALGAVYTAAAVSKLTYLASHNRLVMTLTTGANIVLATSILAVAAPWLPDALPLAFAVLLSTTLAAILSRQPSWSRPLGATAASVAGLAVVWARLLPNTSVQAFLVWGGLMTGFGILIEVHRRLGRAEVDLRLRNLGIVATAAHRLGMGTDLASVATAVLEAYRAGFPHLNWGGILIVKGDGMVSLPVSLTPAGVQADIAQEGAGALDPIKAGEGLAGRAFQTGTIVSWNRAAEYRTQRAAMGESVRRYVEDQIGCIKSAVAVPLVISDSRVIGVISLGSTTSEHEWTEPDLTLASGLADQATVAIQRSELTEEQRLHAHTDHLTGLPNRREFERVLAERPPGQHYSVMVADVDNLKMLNDEYGHEAGDRVLKLVGQVIRNGLRAPDTVARTGGDEFAAFLPATDIATANEIGSRLIDAMQGVAAPFGPARISIGVADAGPDAPTREVWDRADGALYAAKAAGRNQVRAAKARPGKGSGSTRWGDLLSSVLDSRKVECLYQPIVRLDDRAVIGYEALARRMGHSDEGVEGLFNAALHMGLGRDLDWLCRRTALAGATRLNDGCGLFVNVGVSALLDPLHGIDQMLLLTRWAGRQPEDVVLELSEREPVTDRDRLREVLTEYREHGFRFALDDVGEGHSTIEVLASARPEFIKIARALIREPGRTVDGNVAAIAALVTFASTTGAVVVAEGVETDDDVERMRDLGVTLGQGYALGRPAPLPTSLPGVPAKVGVFRAS
jgi:diguanylate cyclase (GGDEF)-like protein